MLSDYQQEALDIVAGAAQDTLAEIRLLREDMKTLNENIERLCSAMARPQYVVSADQCDVQTYKGDR